MKNTDSQHQYYRVLLLMLTSITFVLSGCRGNDETTITGGGCEYTTFEGKAEILSVTPSTTNGVECQSPVDIIYNFMPNNTNDVNNYTHPEFKDDGLVCGDYACGSVVYVEEIPAYHYWPNSQEWADHFGLTVGSVHNVHRVEETGSGNCFPVSFDWIELQEQVNSSDENILKDIPQC